MKPSRQLLACGVLVPILTLSWNLASQSPSARFNILVADDRAFGGSGGIIAVDPLTGAQTEVASGGFFAAPSHVAVDGGGDLFVADYAAFGGAGGVIRLKLDSGSGTWVQSVVSQGGVFKDPYDVIFDTNGDLLVVDFDGLNDNAGRVVRVNPVTGAQTVISQGQFFHQPVGIAIAPDGDFIVTDNWSQMGGPAQVIRVNRATGIQTVVSAGGQMEDPCGLAFDASGQLFIVDANTVGQPASPGNVFRINLTSGAQTKISSGGLLVQPCDLKFGPAGELFVLDSGTNTPGRVLRVDPVTGAQAKISEGGLISVGGTTLSSLGARGMGIVIANDPPTILAGGSYSVPEGGSLVLTGTGFDPNGDPLSYAWDLDNNGSFETIGRSVTFSAAGRDGPGTQIVRLLVCDNHFSCATASNQVEIVNEPPAASFDTPATIAAETSFAIALSAPTDPSAADRTAGFTYAFDCGDGHGFSAFGSTSTATCIISQTGAATVAGRIRDKDAGIRTYTATVTIVRRTGFHILVADDAAFGGSGGIIAIDPVTGAQTAVASGGFFVNPSGVAVGTGGDIFVVDRDAFGGNGGVIRLTRNAATGTWVQSIVSQGGFFVDPLRLIVDTNGDLVIADLVGRNDSVGRLVRVNPVTGAQTVISQGQFFHEPNGIAMGPDGHFYVTDLWSTSGGPSQVLRVHRDTGGQTVVSAEGLLDDPEGLDFDARGQLFLVDANANGSSAGQLFRIDLATGAQTRISFGGSLVQPYDMRFAPTGELLVLDNGAGANLRGRVIRVDPVTGAQTQIPQPAVPLLSVGRGAVSDAGAISLAIVSTEPINSSPVATAQEVTTAEDVVKPITLTGTDPDGNSLTFIVTGAPLHGSLSGTSPSLSYMPALNYHGPDSFTFKVNDGALDSNTATVSITVTPVNDQPFASGQSITTNEDTPVAITLAGSDVDGDAITFSLVSNSSHGTLSGTAPNLTYTPAANYYGPDTFTFKANDGVLDSNIATVSITVNPVNDAPVANNQSVTTSEDTSKAITLSASDPDGDSLTFSVVTSPSHGTLSGTAPNLSYTPAADYYGPDTFTFKANDGKVDSNTATVSITITPVNDPPVASGQLVTTKEDTSAAITLAGSDVDGDSLTFRVVSPPSHGTLSGTASNLTYTPALNYYGPDSFTFKANDGTVDSNIAAVSITVTPVNDAPDALDDQVTATTPSVTVPVLANDVDVDGDKLSVSATTAGTYGTTTANADGTITYALARYATGADTFSYTVTDGNGGTDTANVLVTLKVSARDGIGIVIRQISALALNNGEKNSLINKLGAAERSLSAGNPQAARGQLTAAMNEIQALQRSGRLNPATADALASQLRAIIEAI